MDILQIRRPEVMAGGVPRDDTTVALYLRVNALLRPDHIVLDLGAGRGGQLDGPVDIIKSLATIRGKVARLHGCDVDDAVLENPYLDEARVFGAGEPLPYEEPEEIIPEELEVAGETNVESENDDNDDILPSNDEGQITLF